MKLSAAQERCLLTHHRVYGGEDALRAYGQPYNTLAALERRGLVRVTLGYSGYESTLTQGGAREAARLRARA